MKYYIHIIRPTSQCWNIGSSSEMLFFKHPPCAKRFTLCWWQAAAIGRRKAARLKCVFAMMAAVCAGTSGVSEGLAQSESNAYRVSGPNGGIRARGIVVDSAGNIYLAEYEKAVIRKITVEGEVSVLAGLSGTSGSADGTDSTGRFNGPQSLAVDSANNIYVADSGNHAIRKITPEGVVSTLAGSDSHEGVGDGLGSEARFRDPHGLAVDSKDNVYVTDGGVIRKITPAGMVSTLAVLPGKGGKTEDADKAAGRRRLPNKLTTDSVGNFVRCG